MRTYDPSQVVIRFGDRVVPIVAFVPDVLPRCEHGKIRCGACRESAKDRGAVVVEGVEVLDVPALPPHEPEGGAVNRANVERFVAAVYGVERREPAPAMTADGARIDQALLGRYVLRDGRRVPPWEWPPMRIDLELRPYLDAWLWPDPLSFIGAAANEDRS